MSVVAEITLGHRDLALSDTLKSDVQWTIRAEHRAATLGSQARFYVVDREQAEEFEKAIVDDHTVDEWRLTEAYPDRCLYRIRFSDELKLITPDILDRGIRILDTMSDGHGWRVRLIAPDRAALESLRQYCEREGVSFRLRQLRKAADDGGEHAGFDLTERQREVAVVATEMGYFERDGADAAAVAAALGISKSTLSTHLRAVTAKVFVELFADESRR